MTMDRKEAIDEIFDDKRDLERLIEAAISAFESKYNHKIVVEAVNVDLCRTVSSSRSTVTTIIQVL